MTYTFKPAFQEAPRRIDYGRELNPAQYQAVAALESTEIAGLSPQEKKELLLQKAASPLLEQHAAKLAGMPLAGRVAAAVAILREEGGLTEWRQIEQGYEIANYNCVYRKVVECHQEVCHWHLAFLSHLLGQQVHDHHLMSQGAESCRLIVAER